MAEDIRHFTVTTPAGAGSLAVTVTAINFPPRVVRQIDWRVPTGPMGTLGFLLAMGAVPVLPVYGQSEFVIADGENGVWLPTDYPDSGGWSVWSYNSGTNPHSVYLTFHCDLTRRPDAGPVLLDVTSLYPVPDLSKAGPPVRKQLWRCCQPSRWPITGLAPAAPVTGQSSG